ncbi:MAG: hypothetical protein JSR26_04105 [Proteobacteria bacterium]|nr:hypothetical protein [Pseudomonadota bacterium]
MSPRGAAVCAIDPVVAGLRGYRTRLLNAAIEIADATVRSDVECFCEGGCEGGDGASWYDTSKPFGLGESDAQLKLAGLFVQRALRYIGLRSPDAFPWRFVRHPDRPELVRFEEREAQ